MNINVHLAATLNCILNTRYIQLCLNAFMNFIMESRKRCEYINRLDVWMQYDRLHTNLTLTSLFGDMHDNGCIYQ